MKPLALILSLALAGMVDAQATTLTFMQFDDLHAHLTPHKDRVVRNGQTVVVERGGVARLATLTKQIRADNPNSVLMNIGDTYHGGVEALFTNGNAIADPVNALGIDVGVPGNWDYAYGPAVFRLRYATGLTALQRNLLTRQAGSVKTPAFPNLAANLTYTSPSINSGYVMPPNLIKTIGGVKVGFIGLTSDIVAEMDSKLAMGFAFTQGEDGYKNLLEGQAASLRSQGAQLVVVMSELGLHKNYRLADVVAKGSIDVIFSSHTHEPTDKPLTGRSGALVLESGNDGNLGRLDVTMVAGQKPSYQWKLIPLDHTIPEDSNVKLLVDAARAPFLVDKPNLTVPMMGTNLTLTEPIDKVVGYVDGALDRRHALESGFNNAWADALREHAHTDLAMTPGFRFDAVIASPGSAYEDGAVATGAVTVEDIYRFFPMPYTLATGKVTGARLQEIIEDNLTSVFSLENFNQHGGWVEGYAGLSAQMDLSAPDGTRIVPGSLKLKDSDFAISPGQEVSVAGCQRPMDASDTLCSHAGFTEVQALINPATNAAYYVQELFSNLLGSGYIHAASRNDIMDVANTPLWPAQPFIQPLMVDVTAQTSVNKSPVNALGEATVSVKNTSASVLALPLKIVVESLPAGVSLLNADGTVHGLSFVRLPAAIASGATATVTLKFARPAGVPLTYKASVHSGGV